MKLYFSLFCNDIQAQMAYYLALLGLPEAVKNRSPIYRCTQATSFEFGFHAAPAYALQGLADGAPTPMHGSPVTAYATFTLASCAEVDALTTQATTLGGRIIRAPKLVV